MVQCRLLEDLDCVSLLCISKNARVRYFSSGYETSLNKMQLPRYQQWLPKLLLACIVLAFINVFAIATTSGVLGFLNLSNNRFVNFGIHAGFLWLLIATREWYRALSAKRGLSQRQVSKLVIIAVCLIGALLYFRHGIRLSADSPHYFVQARSLLFDGDFDFTNDYERVRAPIAAAKFYAVGLPLLSLPFLLFTHVLLLVGEALGYAVEANGFGYPYETAFGLASYVLGVLGLLAISNTVSRFFSVGMATLSLLTVWASSFLVWYMVVEPGMPHAVSFATTSFFLCYWLDRRPLIRPRDWAVLGCLAGVAALARWQNGVLLILPILDGFLDSPRTSTRALWAVGASIVGFSPQLIFWKLTQGKVLAVPFGAHGVSWDQLSFLEVLYSTNRGLFPWNPIIYLGVIGLLLWLKNSPRLAALFLLGFFLQTIVNSNVAIWWAGWSFGGRRFGSCILFFVVGTAALFQFLRRRPLIPVVGMLFLFCLWNYGLMKQTKQGYVPPDRMVSFRSVTSTNVMTYYDAFGFPFASPLNWMFSRRYDVSPEKFDRLYGHEGFGNFRLTLDRTSDPYVGRGWGEPEQDGQSNWFRWSIGSQSTILVPLKEPRYYDLTVRIRPYNGALPNRIGLRVNGGVLRYHQVVDGSDLSWRINKDFWQKGINEIQFDYARTARPSDVGASSDSRELALALYRLQLIAVPD